jgi:hypothetical protein
LDEAKEPGSERESSRLRLPRTSEKRKSFLNVIETELFGEIELKLKTSEVNMNDGTGEHLVEFVEQVRLKYHSHSMARAGIDLEESVHFQFFLSTQKYIGDYHLKKRRTSSFTVVHLIAVTPPNLTQVKIWEYLKMETLIEHD